jgi:hypothetical protein
MHEYSWNGDDMYFQIAWNAQDKCVLAKLHPTIVELQESHVVDILRMENFLHASQHALNAEKSRFRIDLQNALATPLRVLRVGQDLQDGHFLLPEESFSVLEGCGRVKIVDLLRGKLHAHWLTLRKELLAHWASLGKPATLLLQHLDTVDWQEVIDEGSITLPTGKITLESLHQPHLALSFSL